MMDFITFMVSAMSQSNPRSTPETRDVTWRLWLAYRGTRFAGWQRQEGQRTVQGEVEKALATLAGGPIGMEVAGRTDSGVHARMQALSFRLKSRLDGRRMVLAMAGLLPRDISVSRADEVPHGFSARSHAVGKRYIYRLHQGLTADPFVRDMRWHIRRPLDIDAMVAAAQYMTGEKDWESFRSTHCDAPHARRSVWHVGFTTDGPTIAIDVRGNAFCRNMVRVMVGTLVEVGLGKIAPDDLPRIFDAKDRNAAGQTAPAAGLVLDAVFYPDDLAPAGIPPDAKFPRYPVTPESWPWAQEP